MSRRTRLPAAPRLICKALPLSGHRSGE
jgi:hypothetical protein